MNRTLAFIGAAALGLAAVLVTASPASAQARVGVRVGARRAPIVRSYYYRPYYYGTYYYGSWYSYPQFYGFYQYPPYPPYYGYGRYDDSSALKLDVKPRVTQVFVDGYYAGTVDDFDGFFQRLNLEPGEHELQLYLPGYRVERQRVYLQPGRTFRVRLTMVPLGPGESEPPRPSPVTAPTAPPDEGVRGPRFPGPRQPRDRNEGPPQPPRGGGERESAYGTLALRVQPGDAEIRIDGERWESSGDDRLLVQLPAGVHHVEARKDGYRIYATDVTVRPGETATLNVALSRQP